MVNYLEDIDALNEIQRAQLDNLVSLTWTMQNACLLRCRKAIGMDDESYRNFKTNNLMEHYYPHGVFCHDKGGRPIAYLPIGGIDSKGIVMHTKSSDIFKAIMFWQEQRKWNCADATKMYFQLKDRSTKEMTTVLDFNH
uniref:Uncharacterized protein n=1 Tax=Romanomermis culicivorax TaxID=13658 RepID=A0A915ID42_ROMCU